MSNFQEGFESKLKDVKESVKYEVTQENQKALSKEVKKIK